MGTPETYGDFRRVLDRKDIDAVVVATPDHWHGIPTILACQAGKDVYCEKPLAHRIQEGRAMVRAAEKYKRVTQMGNLIHAGENYHRVVEIVRSGVLGKISKTRVWMAADRSGLGTAPGWSSAARLRLRLLARPRPRSPVQPQPLHVQLAVLLGLRRRHPHRFLLPHRRPGPLGDGRGGAPDHLGGRRPLRPRRQRRSARYARRHLRISEGRPEVPDGLEPDRRQYPRARKQGAGHHVSGDRRHARGRLRLVPDHPREKGRKIDEPPKTLPRSVGHHREWLDAIKSRAQCSCHFGYGHRLASVGNLGNISLWTGEKLTWDPVAERIINHPEANQYLTKEYRKPWTLPSV